MIIISGVYFDHVRTITAYLGQAVQFSEGVLQILQLESIDDTPGVIEAATAPSSFPCPSFL